MKNYFRSSLIGLVMLTILLLGEMAIAQKRGPIQKACVERYPHKNGKCDINQCKSQCTKNRKNGLGRCMDTGEGHMQCRCDYPCRNP
ncbi:unnamed protein product [Brassica oleracea var. botrytis]